MATKHEVCALDWLRNAGLPTGRANVVSLGAAMLNIDAEGRRQGRLEALTALRAEAPDLAEIIRSRLMGGHAVAPVERRAQPSDHVADGQGGG